jgi:hypothetical protein
VEEVGDGIPDLLRRWPGGHDGAKELGGDRALDPGEHGVVVTRLVRGGWSVRWSSVGGADDMVGEAVATESDKK